MQKVEEVISLQTLFICLDVYVTCLYNLISNPIKRKYKQRLRHEVLFRQRDNQVKIGFSWMEVHMLPLVIDWATSLECECRRIDSSLRYRVLTIHMVECKRFIGGVSESKKCQSWCKKGVGVDSLESSKWRF